jgi:hypothetical protein
MSGNGIGSGDRLFSGSLVVGISFQNLDFALNAVIIRLHHPCVCLVTEIPLDPGEFRKVGQVVLFAGFQKRDVFFFFCDPGHEAK